MKAAFYLFFPPVDLEATHGCSEWLGPKGIIIIILS